ncbi:AAA family ATPase [Streptomyces scabiei]|uniref:AAA family ATPase n=1 Tax=Streptomyces scabiei TaxID=1930 RepID=UPI00099CD1B8|nr:AAA family ATPase [Streptomyces scabiei]MDX2834750.1 AAA family ATPase [Streptomyces scabiei]MDX3675363.1 AAA family ATPase [Streptomyces scabiei]
MRLHSAIFANFRRFSEESSLIIDDPLVALVGPNEAGKTSILQAIHKCANKINFAASDVAKGADSGSLKEPLVRLKFVIEEDDLEAIKGIPHSVTPKWLILNGYVDKRHITFLPMPTRDAAQIEHVSGLIDDILKRGRVAQSGDIEALPESDALAEVLTKVKEDLPSFSAYRTKAVPANKLVNIDSALQHLGVLVHGDLNSFLEREGDDAKASITIAGRKAISRIDRKRYVLSAMENLATDLVALREALTGTPPANAIASAILSRVPSVVTFTEQDRDLPSSIDLTAGEVMPRGLVNLLRLAKVDVEELRKVVSEDDHLRLAEMLEQANLALKEVFQAWRQESVWPYIQVSNRTLRVLVRVDSTRAYTDLHDRSDGLRQFIALVACINAARFFEKGDRDVIVLIDEAENHLHYDAQADLIEVFTRQNVAKQIIYSTHSAGCLPEDLGSGVRVIRQIPATATSSITNWFWSDGSGFTPLLLAMGAATLAFASVRKVIITEGPSDMLLLPSLLRQATGLTSLGYQIAPGLSELSPGLAKDLDLEAARSGFLVDGDPGGRALRQKLIDSGYAPERVLILGGDNSGLTLEDLVDESIYLACANELLDGNDNNRMPTGHKLPQGNPHSGVKVWCEHKGIAVPGKRLIAQALVRLARTEEIVSVKHVQTLQGLHAAALKLLS